MCLECCYYLYQFCGSNMFVADYYKQGFLQLQFKIQYYFFGNITYE
jgi:hypothetical protein